jgi:hypothetical protein
MADGLVLVVHSLHGAVGDTVLGPAQNPIEMPTQHTHEFLEGLQPGAHGRTHPFLQVVAGPLGLPGTDLTLLPLDIIRIYGWHFKIEVSFKQALRVVGAYAYHFWMAGLIAQGLLQFLSARMPELVWRHFGSWIRTVCPGLAPSEQVVAVALRNTLPQFLATAGKTSILVKFIRDRLDLFRAEGTGLAA